MEFLKFHRVFLYKIFQGFGFGKTSSNPNATHCHSYSYMCHWYLVLSNFYYNKFLGKLFLYEIQFLSLNFKKFVFHPWNLKKSIFCSNMNLECWFVLRISICTLECQFILQNDDSYSKMQNWLSQHEFWHSKHEFRQSKV